MKKKIFKKKKAGFILPLSRRVFRPKTPIGKLTKAQRARMFFRLSRNTTFYDVEKYKINENEKWTKNNTFLYEGGDVVDITLYGPEAVHLITIQSCESALFDEIDNAWDIYCAKNDSCHQSLDFFDFDLDKHQDYLKKQELPLLNMFCGSGQFTFFEPEKHQHFISEHWVLPDLTIKTIREAIAVWKTEQKQGKVVFCLNRPVEFIGEKVYDKFLKVKLLGCIRTYFQKTLKKRAELTLTKEEVQLILKISFIWKKDDELIEKRKALQNKIEQETPDFYEKFYQARKKATEKINELKFDFYPDLINLNTEDILLMLNELLNQKFGIVCAELKAEYPELLEYW